MQVIQSTKLANVCYEIRGPVLEEAMRLESAGHRILKLNTGNPAAFGFECPPEILEDILRNVSTAHGYGDAKGLLAARRAVVMHNQTLGIETDVEHVFIGNGVSELIVMAMQGLLDDGDEVLVPAPDYPVDGRRLALRRYGGAPPVRRAVRLDAGPRGRRTEDHRPHQGAGHHQPEQSDGRGVRRGDAARADRTSRAGTTCWSAPTRSTTRSCTTRSRTPRPPRSPRTCSPSPSTACRRRTGWRLPGRLDVDLRPARARRVLTSRV